MRSAPNEEDSLDQVLEALSLDYIPVVHILSTKLHHSLGKELFVRLGEVMALAEGRAEWKAQGTVLGCWEVWRECGEERLMGVGLRLGTDL